MSNKISHIMAKISPLDMWDKVFDLKIIIRDKSSLVNMPKNINKLIDLSLSNNIYYIDHIDEIRTLMSKNNGQKFFVRSYQVYSFSPDSFSDTYISDLGGDSITIEQARAFLLENICKTQDMDILSKVLTQFCGVESQYKKEFNCFDLNDSPDLYVRKNRVPDDILVNAVIERNEPANSICNREIIESMRKNRMPDGVKLKEAYQLLEPIDLIKLSTQLLD